MSQHEVDIMERYSYQGGYFINVGNKRWEEWQGQNRSYTFVETQRDGSWITLNDSSRNIYVTLPVNGGKCYYAWGGDAGWTELYDVTKESVPTQVLGSLPGLWDSRRLHYVAMWELIKSCRYASLPAEYTDELLIAIFWEESTFCNVREVRKDGSFGPAVGFGQTNDTEFWRFPQYKKDQLRNMILNDPCFSVTFAGMFITDLHNRLKNRVSVLKYGYAGVKVNPNNIKGYNGWLECERILISSPAVNPSPGGHPVPRRADLERALHAAKSNGDGFFDQVLAGIP